MYSKRSPSATSFPTVPRGITPTAWLHTCLHTCRMFPDLVPVNDAHWTQFPPTRWITHHQHIESCFPDIDSLARNYTKEWEPWFDRQWLLCRL